MHMNLPKRSKGFFAYIWISTLHVEVCYHEKHKNFRNLLSLFETFCQQSYKLFQGV